MEAEVAAAVWGLFLVMFLAASLAFPIIQVRLGLICLVILGRSVASFAAVSALSFLTLPRG